MKQLFKWLDINFEPVMMAVMFYAITLLLTLQVVLRFVFSTGFSWGEEVARFMFVWLMYFGIAYATRNQRHIRVSFLVQRFGDKGHKIVMIISDMIFLIFSLLILLSAIKVCQSIFAYEDMAVTINVSLNVVYGAGVAGFGLIAIRLIQSIIWKFKNFSEDMEVFENYAGAYTGADKICFLPKVDLTAGPEGIEDTKGGE
ncbi:MAG: TRAP transporter small permease [Spirochaetia bacterium]|nr:TRAP transporter small permease [Spirochaetia bacterium]MCF7942017.1 TRAP transporter small permease [Spirochaetia bacterium]